MSTHEVPFAKVLTQLIYKNQLPMMAVGACKIPVTTPALLRKLLGLPGGNAGTILNLVREDPTFPFQIIRQRNVGYNWLELPTGTTWQDVVGPRLTTGYVSAHAYLPKGLVLTPQQQKFDYNLRWFAGQFPDLSEFYKEPTSHLKLV